jgi:hypothetical protein
VHRASRQIDIVIICAVNSSATNLLQRKENMSSLAGKKGARQQETTFDLQGSEAVSLFLYVKLKDIDSSQYQTNTNQTRHETSEYRSTHEHS